MSLLTLPTVLARGRAPVASALPLAPVRRRLLGSLIDTLVFANPLLALLFLVVMLRRHTLRGPSRIVCGMAVVDRHTLTEPVWWRGVVRGGIKFLITGQLVGALMMAAHTLINAGRAVGINAGSPLDHGLAFLVLTTAIAVWLLAIGGLLCNRERRALWDRVAGTIVIDAPPAR